MSHSAKKCKRGDPLGGLVNIYSVAKYQKTRKGDSLETLKNFQKEVAQCRKKIEREDPLVSSGFVGYVKIVKNERGDTFALISADRTKKNVDKGALFVFLTHFVAKYHKN